MFERKKYGVYEDKRRYIVSVINEITEHYRKTLEPYFKELDYIESLSTRDYIITIEEMGKLKHMFSNDILPK